MTNYVELIKDGIWLIGENSQRHFWHGNWLGMPILNLLGIPDFLATHLQAKVSDFIRDGRWILDDRFRARFLDLCFRIGRIAIFPVIDYLVWTHAREVVDLVKFRLLGGGLVASASGWIKVNTDGASLGSPGVGGCGGVFRTCRSFVNACFAVPLGQVFAIEAELLAASLAINYAWNLGWHRIWLESDPSYIVQFLSIRSDQVTWRVPQAWQRCIHQISHMKFQVSHIFREGNQVADALSKHALSLSSNSWWSSTPSFCSSLVGNDCMGRESFRFS
ncbi:hypothetical protein Dsin_017479 [Dipteronia sinensis]|uniref:RNase H type-1 domain-containing protein n=1 Tax=Dipteronia sinensis TaxID=43782 RepID=A0AAE0AG13_9ROSI|nr:hypothetical protein Dsin_017479 [Dipteronia sinensis]